MFDHVRVEEEVELPYFPDSIDHSEIGWQSKSFRSEMKTYKLTGDGRLLRKEKSYREKTDEEKLAEAEKWGFDSWEEYVSVYDNREEFSLPDELDWDEEEDGYEDCPPLFPSETTLDQEWWADHNMHGSFEFYSSLDEVDVLVAYEARFTKGQLDEILLVGRHQDREDVIDVLEQVE